MICQNVSFDSSWILKMYALRQNQLRTPLGLNLFNEDLLGERNEVFFVGTDNENLITCLQLKVIDNSVLKLRQMATSSDYQNNGKGKKLVQFVEHWARENRYKIIELHAREIAQGFYKKLGYKKVGNEFLEVNIPHYKMIKELSV